MPLTSPGNDDDTGENHQPTLRKNTAEPVEQTLKQNRNMKKTKAASAVTLAAFASLAELGPHKRAGHPTTERILTMIYGLGTVWRCDCCGEYHTLLIIDDYPRVIVLIDGVEVLTLNVG